MDCSLTKRHRWVHEVIQVDGPFVDTCPICRCFLKDDCTICQANTANTSKNETIDIMIQSKNLWQTMLLIHLRPPFNQLDRNIVARIYEFALPTHCINPKCPPFQLYCNHIYHRYCISHWFERRQCCPICNMPLTEELLDEFSTVIPLGRYIVSLQTYDTDASAFLSKIALLDRKVNAQSMLCHLMKHTYPTIWSLSSLVTEYQKVIAIDMQLPSLTFVFDELCEQDLIRFVDEMEFEKFYQYNP